MFKIIKILISCICVSISANAQVKAYPIDGWHSKIEFSVEFGGLIPIKGQFDNINGTIVMDQNNMIHTSSTLYIDASSLNTGVNLRDNHLKGEDFFDVENHPKISFSSTKVVRQDEQFIMHGDLKIRDINKRVEIPIELLHGEKLDSWKNYRITLKGKFEINRSDFEVGKNQTSIGEKVSIEFIVSARIFNTEKIALFKREFGKKMTKSVIDGNKASALEMFKELNRLNDKDAQKPSNFEFLYLYLKQKGYDSAADEIAELFTEVFPEESDAHSLLGKTYFEKGAYNTADEAFQKALLYNENNTLAQEMLKLIDTLKE